MSSACVTSILRTYYTWLIDSSPDDSYHILRMGFCAQAEIATGMIVSCLPVTPRFVQHFAPKVYRGLLRTNYESTSGYFHKMKITPKVSLCFPKQLSRSRTSRTFNNAYSQEAHLTAENIELHEYDRSLPISDYPNAMHYPATARLATARHDLESRDRSF
jgi:hypothetical protein